MTEPVTWIAHFRSMSIVTPFDSIARSPSPGGLAGLQQVELVLQPRAAAGQDLQAHALGPALLGRGRADVVGRGGGDRHEGLAALLGLAGRLGAGAGGGLLLLEREGAVRDRGGGRLSHSP